MHIGKSIKKKKKQIERERTKKKEKKERGQNDHVVTFACNHMCTH